jgi:2-C-methyl-D-erythritol 4-phosphate cytidylyltransferase
MRSCIIVGGGSGSRFGDETPKQFLPLLKKPILMHTIDKFYQFDPNIQLIVVLPIDFHPYWEILKEKYHFTTPHQLVKGGESRFESVKNGLKAVQSQSKWIAVHDAVRPLISVDTIKACFEVAQEKGNAVLASAVVESIRKVNEQMHSEALNRNDYVWVQTPQVFSKNTLNKAYNTPFRNEFTDDASVVEFMGEQIHLYLHNEPNLKITYPVDLYIVESVLSRQGE